MDTTLALSLFEEKQESKSERFHDLANKNKAQAETLYNRAHQMAECIPLGQPILVGHHSESRDRNFRDRIHNTFGKSFETQKKAEYYQEKAARADNPRAISSDDPNAPEKIREKLEGLEKMQAHMKAVNTALRKQDGEALKALGITDAQLKELQTPDFAGRTGFPAYELTNNNANIRRLKLRIAELETKQAEETTETEAAPGVRIVENVELNRVQIFFPSKPADNIRDYLKHSGFHWSSYNGAWQRHRSRYASDLAKHAAAMTTTGAGAFDNKKDAIDYIKRNGYQFNGFLPDYPTI